VFILGEISSFFKKQPLKEIDTSSGEKKVTEQEFMIDGVIRAKRFEDLVSRAL
jgi:hypothetical protein